MGKFFPTLKIDQNGSKFKKMGLTLKQKYPVFGLRDEYSMPSLLISIHSPAAEAVAQELAQMLLAKQTVGSGFPLTALDTYAFLEFSDVSSETTTSIESEIQSWIANKHRGLRLRRVRGSRQKQNLGMPTESASEITYLEIRK